MRSEPYVFKLVLDYLKSCKDKDPVTSKQVIEATGVSYGTIARTLRELARTKRAKKTPYIGHSFRYEYLTDIPKDSKKKFHITPEIASIEGLKSDELYSQLIEWADKGPKNNLQEHMNGILYTVAKLYNAAIFIAKGNSIDNGDLDPARQKLERARFVLDSTVYFIDRLLATTQLWDGSELSSFLLEGRESTIVNDYQHAVEDRSYTK